MKRNFLILILFLLTVPHGIVSGQISGNSVTDEDIERVLTLFDKLKNGENSFCNICGNQENRDEIGRNLMGIKKYVLQKKSVENIHLKNFIQGCDSIKTYDNNGCKSFLNSYRQNKIESLAKEYDTSDSTQMRNEKTTMLVDSLTKEVKNLKSMIQSKKEDDNMLLPILKYPILFWILLLYLGGLLFLIYQFRKEKRKIKEDIEKANEHINNHSHYTHEKIDNRFNSIEQKIGKIDSNQHNYMQEKTPIDSQSESDNMGNSKNNKTHQSSVSENSPKEPKEKTTQKVLYAKPKAGTDNILFKAQSQRADDLMLLYVIHPDEDDPLNGDLELNTTAKPEYVKKYISERNQYLQCCKIVGNTANNPGIIKIKKTGRVRKDGSDWKVIIPPEIELI